MAFTKTTKTANRYGLDIKIYEPLDAAPTSENTPILTIDYANVSNIDISSDVVWATGGQAHANKVKIDNPLSGTFSLETQLQTMELLGLIVGDDISASSFTGSSVEFDNSKDSQTYTIVATTVWKAADGTTATETLTFWRASPSRALNIAYDGSGDPVSMTVNFELAENDSHKVLTVGRA